jgi:hypothetical protein
MINWRTSGILLTLILAFASSSEAKTLYVNGATGNDSTSWADNGPSNPWQTIGRAAWGSANRNSPNANQAAQAGDRVSIAAGTYNSSLSTGQGRYDILYNPVNSGTQANPITFVAEGTVAVRAPTWGGPALGARFVDYIVWFGPFLVDENFIDTEPDTGPVVFNSTTGSGIDGATIHGIGAIWADNHVGVRFDVCSRCFVRNSTIDNFKSSQGPTSRNGAAIMLYDDDDTVIESNELVNSGTGIYIKGTATNSPMDRTIVRYNLIRDMLQSGIILYTSLQGRIYQNILQDNPIGIFIGGVPGPIGHSINDVIANNTVDGGGSGYGIYYNGEWENLQLRNNIWVNMSSAHVSESWAGPTGASNQHSLYSGIGSNFAVFTTGGYTFQTWRSSLGQGQGNPASIVANPMFVNAAGGDYHLQSGSPAQSLGVDLLDLDRDGSTSDIIPAGAYVTGDESIGSGFARPRPLAPTALSAL